jgi:hypothetical protein
MTTSEAYRLYAAECMQLAQSVSDPRKLARLVEIAQRWRDLADQAEQRSQNSLEGLGSGGPYEASTPFTFGTDRPSYLACSNGKPVPSCAKKEHRKLRELEPVFS